MGNQVNEVLALTFLKRFTEKSHLRNWILNFLDLDFPDSWIDPESNSSPIDWMFTTYKMYEENRGSESPDTIVISSRESYKTLSEAVFSIIMMIHFGATISHMAAIVPQATAAQKYIESFLIKIQPYLDYHKIALDSKNSKEIVLKMPSGENAYMKIIVCTLTGANSSHTNIFCIDEIDTIRSAEGVRAYKEAQMIPGVFNGQHPVTIKTSTLKFPGGLFMKEWDKAKREGYSVFKWNLLDITEKCQPSRCKPDSPKEKVYVQKALPLKTITVDQYKELDEKDRAKFDAVEAMAGCAKCPILPICRSRLAARPDKDVGGLWKPIDFTISQFKKTDPDLAESQLMCWKPSSQGMVYPRFVDSHDADGNVYTIEQAWEIFTGDAAPKGITIKDLVTKMISKGVKFYCGGDFGSTHAFAIVVTAILPNGQWWIVDAYSVPNLEFEQMMDLAKRVRDMYRPVKWYMDTAQPMFIKAFKKNKMPCPAFTKDIRGGIECVRAQIVDASGRRRMKVLRHERNEIMFRMFAEHCFKLDSIGNLTDEPDDSDIADVADSTRYAAQNLFAKSNKVVSPSHEEEFAIMMEKAPKNEYQDMLSQKVRNLAIEKGINRSGASESQTFFWSFGEDD